MVIWRSRWNAFWTSFRTNGRKHLKTGWLITAGIVAIYLGAFAPLNNLRGIAQQKGTGLASVAGGRWEPVSISHQHTFLQNGVDLSPRKTAVGGYIGGVPGRIVAVDGLSESAVMEGRAVSPAPPPPPPSGDSLADRRIVRTGAIDLVVHHPAEVAEKIRTLAERLGGFLVSSEVQGGTDAVFGSLTVRVPATRFEEARQEIRKMGLRIESEKVEAQDVTRQYVDQEASLRNLRAEEAQYLSILKRAATVKDTLEVSEKLSEVRGQIEQQQAEHEALAKQVETVAITVSLRAEAEAQVFGLHWRPLYQAKLALRDGVEALADYAATMTSFVFYLPSVLLWLMTILAGAAVGWRVLRRMARLLFGWPKTVVASEGAR